MTDQGDQALSAALDLFYTRLMRALEDYAQGIAPGGEPFSEERSPSALGAVDVARRMGRDHGIAAAAKRPALRLTRAEIAARDGRYDPRR